MRELNRKTVHTTERLVRILQFGEGNFLRAFCDLMIDRANEVGIMNQGIIAVQPRSHVKAHQIVLKNSHRSGYF